jgi:hypothetical protein
VPERKPFLLRIDRDVLDAVQRWADDDLRSLNGQIEFLLREALRKAKRISGQPVSGSGQPVNRSTGHRVSETHNRDERNKH